MSKNKLTAYICSTLVAIAIVISMDFVGGTAQTIVDSIDVAGYWTTLLTIYLKKEVK